jgi:hypothetical protein
VAGIPPEMEFTTATQAGGFKDTLNNGMWNVVISNFPMLVGKCPSLSQRARALPHERSRYPLSECLPSALSCWHTEMLWTVDVPETDPNGRWSNIDGFVRVFNCALSSKGKAVISEHTLIPAPSTSLCKSGKSASLASQLRPAR